jgi:hypothetical protein
MQTSLDVLLFKMGVRLQDRYRRLASRKQAEQSRHWEAQTPNAAFATRDLRVDRNPVEYDLHISYK